MGVMFRVGLSTWCIVSNAGFRVYMGILLMMVSGCKDSAAHDFAVLKFMLDLIFTILCLFLPNSAFNFFGELCQRGVCNFVIAQNILWDVISLSYMFDLFSRRRPLPGGHK